MESAGRYIKDEMWGIAPAAIVAAYFGADQLKFCDPAMMATLGLAYAVSLIVLMLALAIERPLLSKTVRWAAFAMLATSTWFLNKESNISSSAAEANEVRCRAIQKDMLSAHPLKANGAEIFQALGCHPQGADTRVYVPVASPLSHGAEHAKVSPPR